MPPVEHLAVDRPGPFGGAVHTTLCNRVRDGDDYNRTFDASKVTCKFCLRMIQQRGAKAKSEEHNNV